ncbi:MAG: hypothetical protein EAZ57_11865 [Cytophagales bacterium]|nr:MAG: hypothetical protein EAZ57_11865 [Cytophagales bacterium]
MEKLRDSKGEVNVVYQEEGGLKSGNNMSSLNGLMVPHGADGEALKWDASKKLFTDSKGKATRPETITDDDGSEVYKEATLYVNLLNINKSRAKPSLSNGQPNPMYRKAQGLAVAAVFSHESEHFLNKGDVAALLRQYTTQPIGNWEPEENANHVTTEVLNGK